MLRSMRMVCLTDITLPAILRDFLSKILQELTAATFVLTPQHGLDALTVLRQALFVNGRGQTDVLAVLASLQITDIRHLPARDKLNDVLHGEHLQCLIDIVGLQAALAGYHTLVDKTEVGKESAVVAQQGNNHFFLVGRVATQAIEIVAGDEKSDTRLIVLLLSIFQIACPLQNLQGSMYTDREVVELSGKVVDIEFASYPVAIAGGYLIVICQVVVNLADILLFGEGVADALMELGFVGSIIEQPASWK